ncbi:MAG TPA: hypothetical protein VH637_14690 [Streptosporangiaceae bacterium]|jgi:hypothetical protein
MTVTDGADAPGARYHFRSWLRRGIGADAGQPDGPGLPDRAALTVTLNVTAQQDAATVADTPPPQLTVHLYGPGDVVGIDPRHVIRTEPRDQTVNFEPNYLAGIEFGYPDLPWLFTPAQPDGDRLRPFVALIALKTGEFTAAGGPPGPLPAIDVQVMSALQPLADAWNWAHAQIAGDADLTSTITASPAAAISRVLCPRRLDPESSYTAFLVPAFEIGRQAGLGMDVSGLHTAGPAWTAQTSAPLRLPVYYQFSFRTSDAGDFESLVRKLTPTILPAEVGISLMAVDHPAPGVPGAGGPLGLEGALRSALTTPTSWTGPDRDAFQAAVQDLVNLTAAAGTDDPDNPAPEDPRIVPPFYGKWAAAAAAVDHTQPGWPGELNTDPRNRAAAGMGTQIVQAQRTALLASAWDQVAGVEAANAQLRAAQLSRAAMSAVWNRQLSAAGPGTLLALTAPVQARMLASPRTVYATIAASRVPHRIVSGAYRRAARPLGPVARRAAALAGVSGPPAARPPLLERINAGQVLVAPPPPPPGGMTSIDGVSDAAEAAALPGWLPGWLRALITWLARRLGDWLPVLTVALGLVLAAAVAVIMVAAGAAGGAAAAVAVVIVAAALGAAWWLRRVERIDAAADGLRLSGLTLAAVQAAPPATSFAVSSPPSGLGGHGSVQAAAGPGGPAGPAPPPEAVPGGSAAGPALTAVAGDSPAGARFRAAAGLALGAVHGFPADPAPAPALDLAALSATVLAKLDPARTVLARMSTVIRLPGGLPWFTPDPIEPIMAAPDFPQPMYAPLRDLNQDYLLPGVELIPPDTLGAVLENHAFIESFLVGLNHEMARQLLWDGYPTDQRGSYFRQFWDVAGYLPQAGDPASPAALAEALKDIPPINTWPLARPLGSNENRPNVVPDNVVLLVRGELLRRYPNTVIFAGKAKAGADGDNGRVLDETDERYPVFRGTLSPDITFFGFSLSADDARGGTAAAPLGFFFVFQEQPTEPRFGLEPDTAGPVRQWEDLAWTSFGGGAVRGGPAGAAAGLAGGPTLPASAVSSVFPALKPTEISRYRVASTVFAGILASRELPAFLSAANAPSGVALDGSNPEDSALAWGQDAAQTAAITLRMPFRIMIHADSLLPPRPS